MFQINTSENLIRKWLSLSKVVFFDFDYVVFSVDFKNVAKTSKKSSKVFCDTANSM